MAGCTRHFAGHRLATSALAVGLVLAVLTSSPAVADGGPASRRVTVLFAADDVFSQGPVGMFEHLAAQRLLHDATFQVVDPEDLLRPAGRSPAETVYHEALADMRKGLSDYENLELDDAVQSLDGAVRKFLQTPSELVRHGLESYHKSLRFLGAAWILKGEVQEGQEWFRRLLVHDRRARLDETLFPPHMVATFEAVRRDILDGPIGSLSVVSSPSHAKVYVDDVFRGVAPCQVDRLPAGEHLVVLRKAGHETWGQAVRVEEGGRVETRCRLLELTGGAALLRAASGANLGDAGRLPGNLQSLARQAGVDLMLLGRLRKQGEGIAMALTLFDTASGAPIRSHRGSLHPQARDVARIMDNVVSFLVTGREDVISFTPERTGATAQLRLQDEELFAEETTPVYKRWYFWTAIGVGAGTAALLLALLLPKGGEPQSQILLEFDMQP